MEIFITVFASSLVWLIIRAIELSKKDNEISEMERRHETEIQDLEDLKYKMFVDLEKLEDKYFKLKKQSNN